MNKVIFPLTGVSKSWLINHEADLKDWPTFCVRFRNLFGRPINRVAEAHQMLSNVAQKSSEFYLSFIKDVTALRKPVCVCMPELEKVKHITR